MNTPQSINVTDDLLDAPDGARLVIGGWWYERSGMTWNPDFPPLPASTPNEELPVYKCDWTCTASPCRHELEPPPGYRRPT